MVKSKNLGLSLNGSSEQDVKMTFSSWRKSINGEDQGSNMNIIDRAIGAIQTAVEGFKNHKHSFSEITDKPDAYPPEAHGHPWSDITNKPTTFAPATHDHSYNDLKDTPSIPDVPAWAMKTDKPSYSADEIIYGDNSNVGEALGSLKNDVQDKTRINYLMVTLQSQTIGDVTFTNNDGKIILNGTPIYQFGVTVGTVLLKANKTYKLIGCKDGGWGTYSLRLNSSAGTFITGDIGEGVIYQPETDEIYTITIYITSTSVTFDNVVFKPMITTDLAATYDDFVSYDDSYVTGRDVIDKSSIGDAWASGKTYAVGDYCISGNRLYCCKTAHTAGSAFDAAYWYTTSLAKDTKNISEFLGERLNVYTIALYVGGTRDLSFKSRYDTNAGTGSRQSVFLFGMANGTPVYGLVCIVNNGTILFYGNQSITGSLDSIGRVTLTLPDTAYDNFVLISADKISV